MQPASPQFPKISPAEMSSQLKSESADYAASQPKERNQGWLHSGVNQVTYNSYTGISKKPVAVGNSLKPAGTI